MKLTCHRCGTEEDIPTRSDEKFGQIAAKMGWLVGLPHGWQWCPACSASRSPSRTINP